MQGHAPWLKGRLVAHGLQIPRHPGLAKTLPGKQSLEVGPAIEMLQLAVIIIDVFKDG